MRETRGRGAGALGLDFGGVDSDADGPGGAKDDCEEVDADNDHPAARPGVPVHGVARIQRAHEEHGGGEADAAVDGALTAAPLVGEDGGGYRDCEHDDGGNAGGEESGLGGGEASLFEEQGRVLGCH